MYKIEVAREGELEEFHNIIISRCKWLEEKKVNQWKVTSYPIKYDINYFRKHLNKLYIIKDDKDVLGGFLLKDADEKYWSDSTLFNAYYIHHFATKLNTNGLGKKLILFAINKAKEDNKEYLRLDCVAHNKKLNEYYKKLGFKYSGESWSESLWQIKL